MKDSFSKVLRKVVIDKKVKLKDVALAIGLHDGSHLSKKLANDNFRESEMRKIAAYLELELEIKLVEVEK